VVNLWSSAQFLNNQIADLGFGKHFLCMHVIMSVNCVFE